MPRYQASDSLGIRQQALNDRVNEAFNSNVKFDDLKDAEEVSELDKLFKIDLAAKYKNAEYIIEVLKSADSLYTTRALKKCSWLFDKDHAHIINPEYLHSEIFPFTSLKMKRKILSHVSIHVRDEQRSVLFYSYCMETKLANIALKFLIFTPESFKLSILTEKKPPTDLIVQKDDAYLVNFLKKSFILLDTLLDLKEDNYNRRDFVRNLRYWYNYDANKYLDIVEKYGKHEFDSSFSLTIVRKHKERVLAKPNFYIPLLNRDVLVKHSSADDAKVYAVAVLPENFATFWHSHYYSTHSYFLDLIPRDEIYAFLKKIFNERYPDKEFETTKQFYEQNYYEFMTKEQQEAWAWKHVKSDKQILGIGHDNIWYGFINFKDAFKALKNFVAATKDIEMRTDMLKTIVKSAKNDGELEELFKYYEKKHLNEMRLFKSRFLDKVIADHNVYEFNESCWDAFYTLLLSMDIYNDLDYSDTLNNRYKTVALLFYIVNEKEIPDLLTQYALKDFHVRNFTIHLDKLSESKRAILYEYLHSMYTNNIMKYKNEPFSRKDEDQVRRYFENLVFLMKIYHEEAEPYEKYVHRPERIKRHINRELSDRELLRRLKKDSKLVTESLPEIGKRFEKRPFKMNSFLKKIKLYFADDISKNFFELFENNVAKNLNNVGIDAAVNGIFQLADETYKANFMITHAPDLKVDYNKMDRHELRVQKAICRFFCRSRPPVPLENVYMYLKGDYVKECLHIFNMYLANLSIPMCLNFVEGIIDAPVSVRKHGIRLAFQCFDTQNLKNLVTRNWKKNKNVPLRGVIYKALYKKVTDTPDKELFEVLKMITLDLRHDDDNEIFDMLVSNQVADEYLGEYIAAAWTAVSKFKNKEPNISRKIKILKNIREFLSVVDEVFVRTLVLEEVLEETFRGKAIYDLYKDSPVQELLQEKWKLAEAFIIHAINHSSTPIAFVYLTTHIAQVCIESWTEMHGDQLIYQMLCFDFIRGLKWESNTRKTCDPINSIPVFETILDEFLLKIPLPEVYTQFWDLKLTIVYNKVVQEKPLNSDTCVDYGKEVGKMVVEVVKDEKYFPHMVSDIKEVMESHVNDYKYKLHDSGDDTSFESCLLKFASGLMEQETVETYILAAGILPENNDCYQWDSYKDVVSKLSKMEDPNVQCAMYVKLKKKF